ncbi:Importin beta-like SAD2 [Abeliophyllum distichum]|uniref:Importin beta-like SAD2 n=1 Tax=Abeliophyllum distichum TaxID=126358 RepID=A0ABD1T0W0_9LAMI
MAAVRSLFRPGRVVRGAALISGHSIFDHHQNSWRFRDVLVPLVNYISRSTVHFLTCKEPDYQKSLWNMISSIMFDKNLEDGDIEPVPKLVQAIFQNCRGQVDSWVEPYIRITVERLGRAKTPYFKCLLIEVVADALYYNASLTLNILQKLNVATEVFSLWFQMMQQTEKNGVPSNFKRYAFLCFNLLGNVTKRYAVWALTSLFPLPADHLSGESLEHVLKYTLDLLVAYKDQVAEASKEEDKAALSTIGFRPIEDYENCDEFRSPIDDADPFVFFVDTVKALQAYDPLRFQNLMQTLDFHYQTLANGVAQHAEQRRVENSAAS